MEPTVRKQKSGDQLTPGDWLAPHELLDGAAEVLHVLAYRADYDRYEEKHVHLVVREQGRVAPYADVVGGGTLFDLATEADLAELREQAERAQKISDIRALAAWLEANPWAPMPNYYDANAHLDARHPGGPSETEAYAKVREVADRLGVQVEERLDDRTTVSKAFGPVTYQVIAWHADGRPADPEPVDPTGQLYSREADDPTPVSGARVEPHVGGMTEGGLVDETPAEPVIHVVFPHHNTTQCGIPLGSFTAQDSSVTSWSDRSTCAFCAEQAPF